MVRGIRNIGEGAFSYIQGLKEIVFEEGLEEIGKCAFACCSALEEVTLTKGIRKIEQFCFLACKHLKHLEICEGIEEIQYGIVEDTFVEAITLPIHNIPKFHKYALGSNVGMDGNDCSGPPLPTLKKLRLRLPLFASVISVPFPRITKKDDGQLIRFIEVHQKKYRTLERRILDTEGIEEIGDFAFATCRNLERIKMVRGIRKIGESAFHSCYSLKNIVLKEGLEEIAGCAFAHTGLEKVTLTKGIRKIGRHCFYNCKLLKTLEIFEGIEEIRHGIVEGTSLEVLTLPIHNIPTLHRYALGSNVGFVGSSHGPPLPTLKTLRLRLPLFASVISVPFPRITEKDDGQLIRFIEVQQKKYRTLERRILDTVFYACFALKCTQTGLYNAHGAPVLARVFRFWFRGARAPFPI
eukprot:g4452.t1